MAAHFLNRSTRRTPHALTAAGALLLLLHTTGCHESRTQREAAAPAASTDTANVAERYTVTGRIRSITPDRDFIMVRHDAIEGFMDAMTMPFAVQDTSVISGVAAGDSVQFEIAVVGYDAVVTSLEKR